MKRRISRREFLKINSLISGAYLLKKMPQKLSSLTEEWTQGELLGRNCTGGMINLRSAPSAGSAVIRPLYEDAIFPWLREVVGEVPPGLINRKWVETPEGYVYASSVQPVRNEPNIPLEQLPDRSGVRGMWAEVTVPYVDLYLINPPPRSPWLRNINLPRLYYSQVVWVEDIVLDAEGKKFYQVNERYGSYGDIFWVPAETLRPITEEEISPINPEIEDKRVVVDVSHQTLSCFEGNREVYFCRISSGARFDAYGQPVDEWSTPLGTHQIWRKLVSIHMAGGGIDTGWDTLGIGWTCLFVGEGVAIHSTFWHNDFGTPRSHGCVNVAPQDAKWIFRWTNPIVSYEPGDLTVEWPGGTSVTVTEG